MECYKAVKHKKGRSLGTVMECLSDVKWKQSAKRLLLLCKGENRETNMSACLSSQKEILKE